MYKLIGTSYVNLKKKYQHHMLEIEFKILEVRGWTCLFVQVKGKDINVFSTPSQIINFKANY